NASSHQAIGGATVVRYSAGTMTTKPLLGIGRTIRPARSSRLRAASSPRGDIDTLARSSSTVNAYRPSLWVASTNASTWPRIRHPLSLEGGLQQRSTPQQLGASPARPLPGWRSLHLCPREARKLTRVVDQNWGEGQALSPSEPPDPRAGLRGMFWDPAAGWPNYCERCTLCYPSRATRWDETWTPTPLART